MTNISVILRGPFSFSENSRSEKCIIAMCVGVSCTFNDVVTPSLTLSFKAVWLNLNLSCIEGVRLL